MDNQFLDNLIIHTIQKFINDKHIFLDEKKGFLINQFKYFKGNLFVL